MTYVHPPCFCENEHVRISGFSSPRSLLLSEMASCGYFGRERNCLLCNNGLRNMKPPSLCVNEHVRFSGFLEAGRFTVQGLVLQVISLFW